MTLMQKVYWAITLVVFPVTLYVSHAYWTPGYVICALLTAYVLVGLYDLCFSRHTLNRLYPVAAYLRYGLEFIRPEIHQYFIAGDTEELPFNREQRNLVYRRAQSLDDTKPFGTEHDITESGWLGAAHSISPAVVRDDTRRVGIGGRRLPATLQRIASELLGHELRRAERTGYNRPQHGRASRRLLSQHG